MSDDSEMSDGVDELQEIIAEYEAKAKEKQHHVKLESNDDEQKKDSKPSQKKKSKKKPKKPSNLSMEVPMDKVIFGDKDGFIRSLEKAVGLVKEEVENEAKSTDEVDDASSTRKAKKRKPAWVDADDEEIQVGEVKRETRHTGPLDHLNKDRTYKEYLTSRFTRIVAQPKWAMLDQNPKEVNSDDEDLLHSVGFLSKPAESILRPHDIHCKRLKDLNRATYAEGKVSSIQFHPTSTAALVAGESGIATIYSIDGLKNEKLHSMRFRSFPIKCAKLAPCGTKAIFGSNKGYYYSYDLLRAQETRFHLPRVNITTLTNFELSPCGRYMAAAGRFGTLHLFDANCNELIHTFKQENWVAGIRFTADSRRIICSAESSNVCIYSLREQRLEHSFIDEGCIKGATLDLSPNQRMLATGSLEGVVNVYDWETVQQSAAPLPLKSFLNLTTGISSVKFNHSSELLAMCSAEVRGAVKLAHFPSGTVYANFPGFQSDIGKVRSVEFSPGSGFMAFGTRAKDVSLFRVKHFKNY